MADQSEHSEKHKMLTGQLYRSSDELLCRERRQARKLLRTFNETRPDELDKRSSILQELFGTLGRHGVIEPPFFCDYGYNIHLGDNFYANFNCVMLDCAEVTIGDNVFLGPGVQIYTDLLPVISYTVQ
jgi:maltose O-acetyltransferase